jgi:pimeloyl-ACP methyl ester carboxylesterase
VPQPADKGIPTGRRIELARADGTRLVGWYLAPARGGGGRAPALLWFYGNSENIGSIWPVLRDFQPPGAALLVVDYPGYGESGGRATEEAIYEAADVAYAALAQRLEIDRVFIYGRSLGSAVAVHTAARHPAAGLILESPFTSARDMARLHYVLVPRAIVRVRLDNVATIPQIRCPVLIFHGTADRLVPIGMGEGVAAAAPGPVELVRIPGAGHNNTYDVGGTMYRDRLAAFVTRLP